MDIRKALLDALPGNGAPVFLAGFDPGGSRLTLHVPAGCDVDELKAQANRAMDKAGEKIRISVRAHRLRQLAFPRSLEHWLNRFDVDAVIHDPTMIVARARGLVLAAKSCRSAIGDVIKGIFFDPDRRTLFVLHRIKSDAATVAALQLRVATIVNEAWNRSAGHGTDNQTQINVQVVADLPRRKIVPVDALSASLAGRIGRAIGRWRAPGAVALAMATVAVPAAAHTDAGQQGHRSIRAETIGTGVRASGEFGVLFGLSVFGDGQQRWESDAFASAGLGLYFGDVSYAGSNKTIRLAQQTLPRIDVPGRTEPRKPKRQREQKRQRDPNFTGAGRFGAGS